MLQSLVVRNLAVIDELDVNLNSSFCVLTGETGAGKSIILEALGLVLGNKFNANMIRSGESKAEVTATFMLSSFNNELREFLLFLKIPIKNHLIINRIFSGGKNKVYVNGIATSVSNLKNIGKFLIEINGQFDTLLLLDPKNHREALDKFAQNENVLLELKSLWGQYKKVQKEYEDLKYSITILTNEKDFIENNLQKLENLKPEENEEQELVTKRVLLQKSKNSLNIFNKASSILEEENGILTQLNTLLKIFSNLNINDNGAVEGWVSRLNTCYEDVSDLAFEISKIIENSGNSFNELEVIEQRLFELRGFARKFNCSVTELPTVWSNLKNKLNVIFEGDAKLIKLEAESKEIFLRWKKIADEVSKKRLKAADSFTNKIMNELSYLHLDRVVFKVIIKELDINNWSETGYESIEFLVQTNPGLAFSSLSKIASGGELSRFMLSLKLVLAQTQQISTIVFDEIDTGVGGATAAAIGEKLSELAKFMQIIVVTHSPQVAGFGLWHGKVEKIQSHDSTITDIKQLNRKERLEEIARMLSGASITPAARSAAKILLK